MDGELDDGDVARLRQRRAELRELLAPRAPARVTRAARRPAPPAPAVPAPAGGWHEPDPVRSERARARPRDGRGRFQPAPAAEAGRRQQEAEQLLADLQDVGVILRTRSGDRIAVVNGALDRETLERVRGLKAELLPLLPRISRFERVMYGGDDVA